MYCITMLEINVFFFKAKAKAPPVKADITADHGPGAAEGTTALSSLLMNLNNLHSDPVETFC